MKRCMTRICCWAILAVSTATIASPLQKQVDMLVTEFGNQVHFGAMIQSMDTGKLLYQSHTNHIFVPASVLKLFTAVAALNYLGPDFRFQTDVLAKTKQIKDGVLQSNVTFKFTGDPTLERKDLRKLVASLEKQGIRRIRGRIYVDDTAFNRIGRGPGWMWDENNFCYAAPINAIIINKNCFYFKIQSGKHIGARAKVIVPKQFHSIAFENSVITRKTYESTCPLHFHGAGSKINRYYLSGCIPRRKRPVLMEASINDMRPYIRDFLKDLLLKHNIKFTGRLRFKKARHGLQVLARHSSQPLSALVKETLKDSDNVIANAIYKRLGASYFNRPGSWQSGAKAIAKILEKPTGIDFKKTHIVDGAGLSRYNLVTPRQLVKLLNFAYHNRRIKNAFINALPISGVDGSLEYRMEDKEVKGKIRAKTGTMSSVTALAGYVTAASGKTYAFSVMTNGYVGSTHKHKELENRICALMAKQ